MIRAPVIVTLLIPLLLPEPESVGLPELPPASVPPELPDEPPLPLLPLLAPLLLAPLLLAPPLLAPPLLAPLLLAPLPLPPLPLRTRWNHPRHQTGR